MLVFMSCIILPKIMNVLDSRYNFLGIVNERLFSYEKSQCVIQQLPFEYSSSYGQGSQYGPESIVQASHYVEHYDIELNREIYKEIGICSPAPFSLDTESPKELMASIEEVSLRYINDDKFLISLGAEHSVSYGVIKAQLQKHPDLAVLQIDAHSDLRDEYQGSKWSHACVMSRVVELGPKLFQVGIRAQSAEEASRMKANPNIHCWYDKDIHESDRWMDEILNRLPKKIYLSIDADGFAAEVCPSVGTAEPGGLGWYQSLRFLKKVFKNCEVVGLDVVELNPRNSEDRTSYNMAQMVYKLINYKFAL